MENFIFCAVTKLQWFTNRRKQLPEQLENLEFLLADGTVTIHSFL